MAETAVNIVIDKLIPLVRDEVTLLKGVHSQVAFVKDQLALMQAYLKDADVKAEMADTSFVVKEWVKQVREVAYRMQDVIDHYLLKVAKRRQRRGVVGVVCKIAFLIRSVIPRHEITSEIGDIGKSIMGLNQGRETFGFNQSTPEARSYGNGVGISTRHDLRWGSHFIEDDQLVGVDHTRNLLIGWLLNGESKRTVISVVGEGGLGKTTIVKNVYNKMKENKSFDCYAWITVSHSLKVENLLKTTIQKFYEEEDNKYAAKEIRETIMDKDTLIKKVREYLHERRYMIVFDDVWEIDFWGGVEYALPADNKSRIIITTRDKGVAEFCMRSALVHIHELKPLHPNDALTLFLKSFLCDPEGFPKELMGLSQDFVKKCEGVPLAIVAISGLLLTKKKIVFEWKMVYDSLRSKFSSDPHLRSVYQVLSESYHDLPYHLKLCLLYFGLFPEDYSIGWARITRLWVAEGFVKENRNKDQTLEERAEEYLAELIRRNLVKVSGVYSYGRISSCKVHDLMHNFIIRKCEELNFCQVMKNQEFRLQTWTRRLSIHENNEDVVKESASNYGRVRSCFVCNIKELPKPMMKSLFSSFELLVVLDFEDSPLDYLPEAVGNLLNLKYLSVKKSKIKTIPTFIGKLQNLETLDLRDTQVRELPVEINKLVKLRNLIAYYSYFYFQLGIQEGVKLNEGIGRLTALQNLGQVDATNGDSVIKEMKNLKKMRRLGINKLSRRNGNQVCTAIKNMTHLCSLSIEADKHEVLELQSLVNPPPYLQRLYLDGHLERLPGWITKLEHLFVLRLSWSKLAEDPLPVLKGLSELLELHLYDAWEGDELHFREGWFVKLKSLTLQSMPNLRTFKIAKCTLPQVESLRLGSCPQMVQVPHDIQNLKALKHLYVYEMPPQFVENISSRITRNINLYSSLI